MSDKLTVVTWFWQSTGWRSYHQKHVNALQKQLEEYLTIPHRLVCVTDSPEGVNCETYPLWKEPFVETQKGRPNCYCRLKLFSKQAREMFGEWVLSIDLDTLIRHDISDLITFENDFKIMKGSVAPYNGSMFLHKTGTRTHAWDEFDPKTSPKKARENKMPDTGKPYFGSDQAWLSHILPNEATWDKHDGIYNWVTDVGTKEVPNSVKIVQFPGDLKPWSGEMRVKNQQIFNEYKQFLK